MNMQWEQKKLFYFDCVLHFALVSYWQNCWSIWLINYILPELLPFLSIQTYNFLFHLLLITAFLLFFNVHIHFECGNEAEALLNLRSLVFQLKFYCPCLYERRMHRWALECTMTINKWNNMVVAATSMQKQNRTCCFFHISFLRSYENVDNISVKLLWKSEKG